MHMTPIAKIKGLSSFAGSTYCIQTPNPDINDGWWDPLQKADPDANLRNSEILAYWSNFQAL